MSYIRQRWAAIAISCITAMLLAGGASLMIPKRYTSTARVLIESGGDPRAATAISTVYLESLKTYEGFASSDTVFAAALQELGISDQFKGRSVDSIKRSVLKVARPANTKIVEISITLGDGQSAQRLAQHIAEQTVVLNRKMGENSTEDALESLVRNVDTAGKRVNEAERGKAEFLIAQPVEGLEKEVDQIHQLLFNTEKELGEERTDLARTEAELKAFSAGDGQEDQARWTRRQLDALRASIASLGAQVQELEKSVKDKTGILETRKVRREVLEAEIRAARADYESSKTKLADAQSSSAYRGERLAVMDPGILPENPSSPNVRMNVLLAFLVAFIGSLVYLAARFGYSRQSEYLDIPKYSVR